MVERDVVSPVTALNAARWREYRDRATLELVGGCPPSCHHVGVALPRQNGRTTPMLILWLKVVEFEFRCHRYHLRPPTKLGPPSPPASAAVSLRETRLLSRKDKPRVVI